MGLLSYLQAHEEDRNRIESSLRLRIAELERRLRAISEIAQRPVDCIDGERFAMLREISALASGEREVE